MRFLPQERCRQKFVAGSDAETGSNHLPLLWISTAKLRVARQCYIRDKNCGNHALTGGIGRRILR